MIFSGVFLVFSLFLGWRGIRGTFKNSKRVMVLLFASWLFFSSFFLLMEQLSSRGVSSSSGASYPADLSLCPAVKGKGA